MSLGTSMFRVLILPSAICVCFVVACGPSTPTPPPREKAADAKPDFEVTALNLMTEFFQDRKAANEKYSGKVVVIQGVYWGSKSREGASTSTECVYLSSGCFAYRCAFHLDEEAMRTRMLFLEIDGLQGMKGRFKRISKDDKLGDELLEFEEAVPAATTTMSEMAVEAEGTTDEVMSSIADDDPLIRSKFYGRKITVHGILGSIDVQTGLALVEITGNASRPVKCIVSTKDAETLNKLAGKKVKATGLLRTSIQSAMIGAALHGCSILPE